VDVGTVSSDDVIASYERQLTEAHQRIAMLEAALARQARMAAKQEQVKTAIQGNLGKEG
jgi:nicotinic acid mononucleotide adenylyltransferase